MSLNSNTINGKSLQDPQETGNQIVYVCICNAVTERDIRDAVDEGARGLDDLRDRLQVATCCGACEDNATAFLSRHAQGGGGLPDTEPPAARRAFSKGQSASRCTR
jgi:bacterioferritin-associated ferredoxin